MGDGLSPLFENFIYLERYKLGNKLGQYSLNFELGVSVPTWMASLLIQCSQAMAKGSGPERWVDSDPAYFLQECQGSASPTWQGTTASDCAWYGVSFQGKEK